MRETNKQIFLSEDNLYGGLTINHLDFVAYVSHLNIFATFMGTLEHIK